MKKGGPSTQGMDHVALGYIAALWRVHGDGREQIWLKSFSVNLSLIVVVCGGGEGRGGQECGTYQDIEEAFLQIVEL